MKAANTIRKNNLLLQVGEGKKYPMLIDLADALCVTASYLSQMLGAKPIRRISEVSARKFEHKLGLRTGALDLE